MPTCGRPNVYDEKKHYQWVRDGGCIICGAEAEAAHLRMGDPRVAKDNPGIGARGMLVNPLCRTHHSEQHATRESRFWRSYGIDATLSSLALLWSFIANDHEQRDQIIMYWRQLAMFK